jgi:ADP-heptose:LPS heptosyltransferase
MHHWRKLAELLHSRGHSPRLIAGHVERERFTPAEQQIFSALGGTYLDSLAFLYDVTRSASLFIAADTGPAHLAAQLGIPTIALFGPTDPAIWRPIGPSVTVLQSPDRDMQSVAPGDLLAAVETALKGTGANRRD